jgi:hypothetical protein
VSTAIIPRMVLKEGAYRETWNRHPATPRFCPICQEFWLVLWPKNKRLHSQRARLPGERGTIPRNAC